MESSVQTEHTVVVTPLDRIEQADAFAAGRLIASVWPRPGRTETDRAEQLLAMGKRSDLAGEVGPTSLLVFKPASDERRAIAHALVFPRTIGFEVEGETHEMTVLALAMVATDPERRGEGLGALVVKAAFDFVDRGYFPFALYQTSFPVEAFYERLGARRVRNRIVNSRWKPLSRAPSKDSNPFWDDIVMRYPAAQGAGGETWPEGVIDLRGEGY